MGGKGKTETAIPKYCTKHLATSASPTPTGTAPDCAPRTSPNPRQRRPPPLDADSKRSLPLDYLSRATRDHMCLGNKLQKPRLTPLAPPTGPENVKSYPSPSHSPGSSQAGILSPEISGRHSACRARNSSSPGTSPPGGLPGLPGPPDHDLIPSPCRRGPRPDRPQVRSRTPQGGVRRPRRRAPAGRRAPKWRRDRPASRRSLSTPAQQVTGAVKGTG